VIPDVILKDFEDFAVRFASPDFRSKKNDIKDERRDHRG
jgi:hypothetical protein